MKALTLGQPHATLVALGVKTILTTEHPTGHRGPLAIHAAKRRPIDGEAVGWWVVCEGASGVRLYQRGTYHDLPLGAVVATARLLDVVPIVDRIMRLSGISDQLPYADFTPGRWTWLLEDVKATTDRCPDCMGERIVEADAYDGPSGRFLGPISGACPTCDGKGTCPPILAKGRSGLWEWSP